MNNEEMLKHLNLLDKAKRDEKTTLKFAQNFELQTSTEGSYYKPNDSHTQLVYDALKFKKLKFPDATDTHEIGSTFIIAPPPKEIDDGVSPIMKDITINLEDDVTQYIK